MMLRSLVKKFKSHSLNEDTPPVECQQQTQIGASSDTTHFRLPTAIAGDQSSSMITRTNIDPSVDLSNMAKRESEPSYSIRNQMLRQQHLRNSTRCTCNTNSVSSIATRLRSSVVAASTNSPISEHTLQTQHHRHQAAFCPHHRRTTGNDGRAYRQTTTTTSGDNAVLENEYCKDSGTESDDEELEQIETNSTHSVSVSQTSDYYTSQQSLSINSCRSSHCSSPLLGLSDQECNSWENVGSESGRTLRATSKTFGSRQQQYHHKKPYEQQHLRYREKQYSFRLPNNVNTTSGFGSRRLDNRIMAATTMGPPLVTEELPQHHYHTRQQFHRLTQQISMKNGLIPQSSLVGDSEERNSPSVECASLNSTSPTAFMPVRRSSCSLQSTTIEQSPEGAGNSSLDELDEFQDYKQQEQKILRRPRSSTMSTMSAPSMVVLEKRKWSQMRQEQKRSTNTEESLEGEKKRQDRPVLHAARKTPIKLLFSLDSSGTNEKDDVETKQLPHRALSPPVGVLTKKSNKSTTKKKCKDDCLEEDLSDSKIDNIEHHRCPKDDEGEEEDEDDDGERVAKRPSLDFNKMREKLVDAISASKNKKKTKRSKSVMNNVGMKTTLKSHIGRREGYQLRSTHRQCCLFRPLEPPTSSMADSGMVDNQSRPQWFSTQTPHQEQQWQRGTFTFEPSSTGQ